MSTELAPSPTSSSAAAPETKRNFWRNSLQQLLAVASLAIIVIVFSIINPDSFLTLTNFSTILTTVTTVGLLALGVTFVIIAGGIDLSIGTVMMCSALLGAYTFKQHDWPLVASLILTVGVGTVFGLLNGGLIAKLKLPPFIATLGTMMMAQGAGSILTKVQSQTWPTATEPVGGWFKPVFIRS